MQHHTISFIFEPYNDLFRKIRICFVEFNCKTVIRFLDGTGYFLLFLGMVFL